VRALRFHAAGDIRVEEVAEPTEVGPGQLLLRNRRAGICGTDLHEYLHGPMLVTATPHPLTGAAAPQILGHEFSAEVVSVGEGVSAARPGDRVAVMPLFFCGRCVACRSGRPQVCEQLGAVGVNWSWGGMSELAVVAEHQVAILPDQMSDIQGAMVEPAAVAVHSVTTAGVKLGDAVLVAGGGPIGQLVGLAAVAAGAGAVYLSEPNERRRARAEVLDLTGLLDPLEVDVPAMLRAELGGGVDVAIDCVGNSGAVATCLGALHPGGVMMQTGLHTKTAEVDMRAVTLRDLTVRGANCFPVDSWPRVIGLIASGMLPVERVVTAEVPLADAVASAFEPLADPGGDHVKIVLDLGADPRRAKSEREIETAAR
jgi:(R,R)-butanediol dehydrogenase / meso-butanediol dehydrogenase / diacetyl reductase